MHDSDEEEEQTALVCDNGKKIIYFSRESKSEINFLKILMRKTYVEDLFEKILKQILLQN